MLERINDGIVGLMDHVLGWMLILPADLQILIVAVGTGAILTFARLFTTDQDLLRRVAADKKRLKELLREAKARSDKEAKRRHQQTMAQVAMKSMRGEGKPLLLALLPILLLATWAFRRLEFHPPAEDEVVGFVLYTPLSVVGQPVHLVVPEEVRGDGGGWVRVVEPDPAPDGTVINGIAVWPIRAVEGEHRLVARTRGDSFEHPYEAGRRTYGPPLIFHDLELGWVTELRMRPVRFLRIVPGIPFLFMPPWMVAYLLLAIPSVLLIRKVFRIH